MGQLNFTGSLTAGPAEVTDDSFPAGESTIPFATQPTPKTYAVDTGKNVANIANVAYAPISGIGATDTVKNATFFYMRCKSPFLVRITQAGGSPGSVQIVNVQGLFVMEAAPGAEITLVELQGAGIVEYYACGNT